MPDDRAVVIHGSGVVEARGNAGKRPLRDWQKVVSLNADDPQQGFNEIQGAVYKVYEKIVGGGYQEGLADLAVEATLHLTMEKVAKIEDGGQAARGTNDVPVLSRGRLGDN